MTRRRTAAPLTKGTAARTITNPTAEVSSQTTPLDHQAALARVDQAFVAVVQTAATGQLRRTAFFSLDAAERAVLRAWDRGLSAEVIVCRLEAIRVGGDL
jgi:hypothetical protein